MTSFINALPGAISQGMIWGIMAIGLYITYRVLEVSDLTVDGSFCTGGCACVMLMIAGCNVWVAMLGAFVAGMLILAFFHDLRQDHLSAFSKSVFSLQCKRKNA